MSEYAKPMARVIDELKRLPGVGSKSAQRIAFFLLKLQNGEAERLAEAFWPGALSLVLPLASGVELAPGVAAGGARTASRCQGPAGRRVSGRG